MINSRKKGHDFERDIANKLKKVWPLLFPLLHLIDKTKN